MPQRPDAASAQARRSESYLLHALRAALDWQTGHE
jgi:hypothetical protein